MTGAGAWLAGIVLAVGPNGWWIDARLEAADDAYRNLVPVEWLDETSQALWIAFHRRDDWVMAAYLPSDAEEMLLARRFPQLVSGQFDRLLPGLEVPRLMLRESVYRNPARGLGMELVDLEALAVDSAETLYNALLEAHVDLAMRRGLPWTEELAERAQQVMLGVPKEHREEAFRTALVDFGSHLLSVAGEVARQSRRHSPERLCSLLDPPRALFGGWQRALGDGHFPGRWLRPAEPTSSHGGDVVTTRETLRAEDKRWWVKTVLRVAWTGDPAIDFAAFCSS